MFLIRPEGWSVELLELGWELGAAVGGAAGEKTSRDAAAARIKHNEAKDRLREAIREATSCVARCENSSARRRLRGESSSRGPCGDGNCSRNRTPPASKSEPSGPGGSLRKRPKQSVSGWICRRPGRRRRPPSRTLKSPGRPTWAKGGAELARAIDSVAAAAVRITPDNKVVKRLAPLRLPKGVRPDGAEAVDLVLDHRGPTHLVVDGYNVGLALASGKAAEVALGSIRCLAGCAPLPGPPAV